MDKKQIITKADTCSKIFDHKENERDFILCLQSEYDKYLRISKKNSYKPVRPTTKITIKALEFVDKLLPSNTPTIKNEIKNSFVQDGIDYECLNLCKQSVVGGLTIKELNSFCKFQCQK